MTAIADFCKETTTTVGTGTYSLAGAVAGSRAIVAGIGSGSQCYYGAANGADWEVGIGTVTAGSPDTLTRDTILSSSNSDTAVSWAAGAKNIFVVIPASRVIVADPTNSTLLNLPPGVLAGLTTLNSTAIAQLTTTAMSAFTSTAIRGLTSSALGGLTSSALQGLTSNVLLGLTSTTVSGLTSGAMSGLSGTAISGVTTTAVSAVTGTQLAALSTTGLSAVTGTQLAALSTTGLNALTSTQAAALSGGFFGGFSSTQSSSLSTGYLAGLTSTQIRALTTTQMVSVSTTQLSALVSTQISALNGNFIAMPPTYYSSSTQVAALTLTLGRTILDSTGPIASAVFTLPSSAADGCRCRITSETQITALTWTAPGAMTMSANLPTFMPGGGQGNDVVYRATGQKWYPG